MDMYPVCRVARKIIEGVKAQFTQDTNAWRQAGSGGIAPVQIVPAFVLTR
jgi:hypothetical protein